MNTNFEGMTSTGTDVWLTPPHILKELGDFDLDPCSPIHRHWNTAKKHYTIIDDGLKQLWSGRVWCNPPYGRQAQKWIKRCADHGDALLFIFARTETRMFFDHIWDKADGLLFLKGRVRFYTDQGIEKDQNAGAPSVLVAYGDQNAEILRDCNLEGKFIDLRLMR